MVGSVLARVRRPEYTGANRCVQCTFVNAVIAVLLGGAVVAAGTQAASLAVGAVLGAVVLVLSGFSIWLRGYLVPGTPTLTKRYFPGWVLGWFGKAETQAAAAARQGPPDPHDEIDPEELLMRVGALEECQGGDELCLTADFRQAWYDEIDRVDAAEAGRERLLDLLDLDEADVSFREYGDAFSALVDDRSVGTWESRPAFLADLGGANVLADRLEAWDDLTVSSRSQLLNGLRLFIDECPACGGTPEFGTETVESCCSTHDVAAVECGQCDARLFESSPI